MRMFALVVVSVLSVASIAKAQSFQEQLQYYMDACNSGDHRACQISTQMMRNERMRMQGNIQMMDQMMQMEDAMHGPRSGWANSFAR